MRIRRRFDVGMPATLLIAGLWMNTALACPFCTAPSMTLSEQMSAADAVLEVEWASAEKGTKETAGTTTYKVTRVMKTSNPVLKPGSAITLPAYREGKAGSKFLLTGTQVNTIEWGTPMDVSPEAFDYIVNSPAPGLKYEERLAYFLKFLEHKDQLIAGDAYGEFANAPFEEIAKLTGEMPREKIREWILDEKTNATRLGLYGLLIGLSGKAEDEDFLLAKIVEPRKSFQLGIEGVMSGYLMISGDRGLEQLLDAKIKTEGVPFSEVYAVMQTLRFMWTYAPDRIPKDSLRAAMRLLLERADMADMAILDLARWEDWSILDRVVAMYDDEEFAIPATKRAIIRYLLICEAAHKSSDDQAPSTLLETVRVALQEIEEKDPALYQNAKRFFRVRQ